MAVLFAIGYDDEATADRVLDELQDLQKDYLIDLQDAAIVTRNAKGKLKVQTGTHATGPGPLGGGAFGALGTAAVTWLRTWQDLDVVTLIVLPLFLFSATFYPIDVYPEWMQVVTWISHLYHGVTLIRGLTHAILDWTMLINIVYLTLLGILGSIITARRVRSVLLK